MNRYLLFLSPFFAFSFCFGSHSNEFIVVGAPDYNPGFFSVINTVIGCLDLYENENYGGIEVNFANAGIYYDKAKGPNWWSYYFEPLCIGAKGKKRIVPYRFSNCAERARHTEFNLSPVRVQELIHRYFKFKPYFLNEISQFVEQHFQGRRVIGVHYRGTDKDSESPRVEYANVLKEILKHIRKDDLLFVATDEDNFLSFIRSKFEDRVISIEAMRSKNGKPIHTKNKLKGPSGYKLGLEALTDAVLLSKCDLLIRTSSNLSLFSTYLDPSLPVIALSQRRPK